eukprot:gb/GEZN01007223.1/.p1 GENE.gb/GEZN01007223.1/~~gb/GEZN01007223.1/.p1  ORF type:complete len:390 (-),score=60.27 gb/GEZN01007223.1/:270-1439(-)
MAEEDRVDPISTLQSTPAKSSSSTASVSAYSTPTGISDSTPTGKNAPQNCRENCRVQTSPCNEPSFKDWLCVDHYLGQKVVRQRNILDANANGSNQTTPERKDGMWSETEDDEEEEKTDTGIQVKITGTETRQGAIYYCVESQRPGQVKKQQLYRYKQFEGMHEQFERFYLQQYPHLADNVPSLPDKRLNIRYLSPHTDDFIKERQAGLEQYLKRLVQLPHAAENPLIFDFLGLGMPRTGARYELPSGQQLGEVQVVSDQIKETKQGRKVVFFTINARLLPSRAVSTSHRRYKEFQAFHQKLTAALQIEDETVLSKLPEFPMRRFRLVEDHTSHDFRKTRRALLHKYLTELVQIPLAANSPFFWKFVGFVDFAYKKDKLQERLKLLEDR